MLTAPTRATATLALLTLVLPQSPAPRLTAEWPNWRGTFFDSTVDTGRSVFAKPFELKVRWRRTLGPGYSGIVISGGHAVTMFSDGKNDVLVSLTSDNGREEWRISLAATFPGRDGSTGGPVSTPAVQDGIVYALGPRGDLVAVRLADGRPVWRRHLVRDFAAEVPHWGFTTSPLVTGDVVVLLTGGPNAVTAFDKRTGEVAWQAGADVASYQSPMLASVDGRTQIVVGGDQTLYGLSSRDGRELWKYAHGGTGFYAKIINPVSVGAGLLLTFKPDQSLLLNVSSSRPTP